MESAVILAGGKGLRFGSDADDQPKPMALVGGHPILHHIVRMLQALGFKKLYIIVAYKKEAIISHFGSGSRYGLTIEYIDNSSINTLHKSGLSDAVLLVKNVIQEPFLTILGDEIYARTGHREMIEHFVKANGFDGGIAVHRTANPEEIKKNYTVKIDHAWNVLDLEEKPKHAWNDLIGCGTYLFTPAIFSYIEQTPLSSRSGKKELADSMKRMIADNRKLFAFDIGGEYLNINYPEDMAIAEKIMRGNNGNNR